MTSRPPPRRGRSLLPEAAVVGGVAAGLLLTWLHHPRLGMYAVAAVLAAAAVFRLVAPARDAALLVVRGRVLDVAVLGFLAVALFVLATVTPFPQPGQ